VKEHESSWLEHPVMTALAVLAFYVFCVAVIAWAIRSAWRLF
jgi:hypothetical protein